MDDLTKAEIFTAVRDIKLTSRFMAEVAIDIIRSITRIVLWSVTSKGSLWLRPWVSDFAFKKAWCKYLFEGQLLLSMPTSR